jgi:hypothetical protein
LDRVSYFNYLSLPKDLYRLNRLEIDQRGQGLRVLATTMSLCFKAAYEERRSGNITEETYLDHLIAHFRGVRHAEDSREASTGPSLDSFGASIQEMVLETDWPTIQGKRHLILLNSSTNLAA